jgi:hypothetical protein
VVATIALFVSLGGASYAAIVLPAHSVGARQLRAGAVTPSALAFPLGLAGVTDTSVQRIYKSFCNSPNPPGVFIAGICIGVRRSAIRTPGGEVHLTLHSAGRLFVSAIAGLRSEGPSTATVTASVGLILDGKPVSHSDLMLTGNAVIQQPAQLLVAVRPGAHTVGCPPTCSSLRSR